MERGRVSRGHRTPELQTEFEEHFRKLQMGFLGSPAGGSWCQPSGGQDRRAARPRVWSCWPPSPTAQAPQRWRTPHPLELRPESGSLLAGFPPSLRPEQRVSPVEGTLRTKAAPVPAALEPFPGPSPSPHMTQKPYSVSVARGRHGRRSDKGKKSVRSRL